MDKDTQLVSDRQLDLIKEILNVGVGHAAASLNSLVDSHIELSLPEVKILSPRDLEDDNSGIFETDLSYVHLPFSGIFSGTGILAFPAEDAVKLVSALTGEATSSSSLDAVMAGTLNEVGNIVINGVVGSVSNLLDRPLQFSLPEYIAGKLSDLMARDFGKEKITAIMAYIDFSIERLEVSGNIALIFEILSFQHFVSAIDEALEANEISNG